MMPRFQVRAMSSIESILMQTILVVFLPVRMGCCSHRAAQKVSMELKLPYIALLKKKSILIFSAVEAHIR